ncbi:hypothetical protein CRU98_08525 [Arcobacter sp. CECT 8986]|uniref:relaxase/mobilization nuclease domain-containing protein n=1 Tax=Arcobacter sp. CECT 8986 TaxID=2044507 RepID=UPI001009E57F|nr:relaxase/mobilization nuclease domain-containing protein [Arcobacter sp. CECT 8986]RXJ98800.1 hypothetical protein CRU98_08525 [Arcobacter sp. CECT 8986]
MVITVNSGSGNLADYLVNGNDNKRDKEKVFILDGDLNLTKQISQNTKYKDKHFHIIVSLKNKYDNETATSIYKDLKKELFDAYREDEVNISAVLHQDTNNTHFHCMIPKKNLLTNTKLDLYFDKRDRKRFELIRDYLDTKYNLASPTVKSLKPTDKTNAITKNWKVDTSLIKTKKDKAQFEEQLLNHINSNLHHFKTHTELLDYLKDTVNIEKFGYDYKNDKFYATIKHNSGTKQRVFSPIFNSGDLKYTLNKNNEKIYEKFNFEEYLYSKKEVDLSSNRLLELRNKLDIENGKYKTHIENRLSNSRQKALNKLNNIEEPKEDLIKSFTPSKSLNYTYPTFISQNKQFFEDLQLLNKSDISKIATKFFNFSEVQREDSFSIIQNNKNKDTFLIYKDKKNNYKFINPATKFAGDTVDFLINACFVPTITPLFIKPIISFVRDLKETLKIISELLLEKILDILSQKFEQKKGVNEDLKSSITPMFDMSPRRDLKPY